MLVAAVLRPEEREDRELEVIRLALEQFLESGILSVGKTELTVDGLFRNEAQSVSLAAPPDGNRKLERNCGRSESNPSPAIALPGVSVPVRRALHANHGAPRPTHQVGLGWIDRENADLAVAGCSTRRIRDLRGSG